METPIKILFVEDDERLAQLTTQYLEGTGLKVAWVTSGKAALTAASDRAFDLVLLDLMLPGRDGIEVCRELRTRLDVPIIIVTARREEADRVIGLEAGADDYVTKPFSSRELVARIHANVRRARGQAGPPRKLVEVGGIVVDPVRMRATVSGRELTLTAHEFAILRALVERPDRVLSREQLLDLVKNGGAEDALGRSIDIHISRLRQKLGDDPKRPRYLRTIRGVGYLLASGADD